MRIASSPIHPPIITLSHWHYAMICPDGQAYWGYTEYLTITPIDHYTALDGFSDETGAINQALPRANWDVTFKDVSEKTSVETIIAYQSSEDLDTVIQMGMKEGMTSTLERLDEFLLTLNK
nr:SRPBCC domain-containing protein [Paremcibacter congregatus]